MKVTSIGIVAVLALLAVASAANATILQGGVIDANTKGNWIGTYGAWGYSIAPVTRSTSDLTAVAQSISSNLTGFTFTAGGTWNYANASAPISLQLPSGGRVSSTQSWYGNPVTFNFTPVASGDFKVTLCESYGDARTMSVDFANAGTSVPVSAHKDLINPPVDAGVANPGTTNQYTVYYSYTVTGTAGVPIALHVTGGNAMASAIFFDPVPEPATMGLLAIGGLAAIVRRRRA